MCTSEKTVWNIHLIWTQCNKKCDQEHWYTYISHYRHMPLNKYIFHIATYMSHCTSTVVYIQTPHYCTRPSKSINYNIYLPYHCKICVRNKDAPQVPQKFDVHLWGKYGNIYGTYEVAPINDVARIAVHKQWWWHRSMMMPTMMPQPDCKYWVGTWNNQSKTHN